MTKLDNNDCMMALDVFPQTYIMNEQEDC